MKLASGLCLLLIAAGGCRGYDNDDTTSRERTAEANALLTSRRPSYEASCAKGEVAYCEVLGDFYHFGTAGTPVDETKSKAFYHRACAGGSPTACKKEQDPDWLAKAVRRQ